MKVLLDTEITTTEFIGYRMWRVRDDVLYPLFGAGWWEPGVNQANVNPLDKPQGGFYSLKNPERAKQIFKGLDFAYPIVFGSIKMWGGVVEHAIGYRAQYAKITALYKIQPWWKFRTLKRLREFYGV